MVIHNRSNSEQLQCIGLITYEDKRCQTTNSQKIAANRLKEEGISTGEEKLISTFGYHILQASNNKYVLVIGLSATFLLTLYF
jgi:hypothetical protein